MKEILLFGKNFLNSQRGKAELAQTAMIKIKQKGIQHTFEGGLGLEQENRKKSKPIWLELLAAVGLGILVNMAGSYLMEVLHFKLYLDTVGTVLVAVVCGYLPAMLVGLITNVLKCITDPNSIYYAVVNILTAVIVYFIWCKTRWNKWIKYFSMVIFLALMSIGHGIILSWMVDHILVNQAHLGEKLLTEYGLELADKFVTILILALIRECLPESLIGKLKIEGWQQKPLSEEEKRKVKTNHYRRMSIRTRIMVLLLFATVSIGFAAMVISTILYKDYTINEHKKLAKSVTNYICSLLDPERIDLYIEEGDDSPEYQEIEKKLYRVRDSYPDIEYVYIYKIEEDGCHVVFDLDTEELEGGNPGEVVPFDESFKKYVPDLLAGKPISPIITDDTYGWLITVYKPLYDEEGDCRCYVAADISMELIRNNINSYLAKLASIYLGIMILIIGIGFWISEYNIILPINAMAISASAFTYDNEEALEDNVEKIKTLDIHTGDEIENMYQAFSKTTENNMKYANDLQIKTETISQMQNALIMVLADMVESRDENTGDHVRKTAAYTRIIMEKMKELGYYTDQLTPQFMYDVEHSAPLHDIGKIAVSDVILNKPGRLTDEEFAIMKTHTTAGSMIIEQAIETVPDSWYLKEAKNLAEFHHEKWNGKGYPHGLSGEDIPLSARIMAVADVFDALVSERCYKKAFSFEKAMEIIKNDAGSHFDPKVADAFLQSADQVRKIAEHFSQYKAERDVF